MVLVNEGRGVGRKVPYPTCCEAPGPPMPRPEDVSHPAGWRSTAEAAVLFHSKAWL